jgi:hypothetical protein
MTSAGAAYKPSLLSPLGRTFTSGSKLGDAAKRWRRLVLHSLVSEDAAFDARRTAPVKPPPRFVL